MTKQTQQWETPLWVWVLGLVTVGIGFYPSLRWLVQTWLGSPYYGHGLLVPLVSAALAWRRERGKGTRDPPRTAPHGRQSVGLLAVGAAIAFHVAAQTREMHGLSAVAMIVVLGGLTYLWAGPLALSRHSFSLAFLLLMIPLPGVEETAARLAQVVARSAATALGLFGISSVVTGAQLRLGDTAVVIGAPCSGLSSLTSLTTLAVLSAHALDGPVVGRLMLVVSAVPMAMLSNLVRVLILLSVAYAGPRAQVQQAFHTISSPVLFLMAVGLLVGLAKALGCGEIRSTI